MQENVGDLIERYPERFHARVLDLTDTNVVHQIVDRSR